MTDGNVYEDVCPNFWERDYSDADIPPLMASDHPRLFSVFKVVDDGASCIGEGYCFDTTYMKIALEVAEMPTEQVLRNLFVHFFVEVTNLEAHWRGRSTPKDDSKTLFDLFETTSFVGRVLTIRGYQHDDQYQGTVFNDARVVFKPTSSEKQLMTATELQLLDSMAIQKAAKMAESIAEFDRIFCKSQEHQEGKTIKDISTSSGQPGLVSSRCRQPLHLPPEIMLLILEMVDEETIYNCALVNRNWTLWTKRILWSTFDRGDHAYKFLIGRRLSEEYALRTGCKEWDVSRYVFDMELTNTAIFINSLFSFLNLKKLSLQDVVDFENLIPLFIEAHDQLPSLRELRVEAIISRHNATPRVSGYRAYDHDKARSFFSKLHSIKWGCCKASPVEEPFYLDSVHENLRVCELPDQISDDFMSEFLRRVGPSLRAIHSSYDFKTYVNGGLLLGSLVDRLKSIRAIECYVSQPDLAESMDARPIFTVWAPTLEYLHIEVRKMHSSTWDELPARDLRPLVCVFVYRLFLEVCAERWILDRLQRLKALWERGVKGGERREVELEWSRMFSAATGTEIIEKSSRYVPVAKRYAQLSGEEQEKELENELEEIRQVERPGPATAYAPMISEVVRRLAMYDELDHESEEFLRLPETLRHTTLWPLVEMGAWSAKILVTKNFANVVERVPHNSTDDFLRPVKWMVVLSENDKDEGRKKRRLMTTSTR
ncbi:hypothetical protein HK102_003046 [Quaeritorhiza haematococci]|nr:hypothetical protein HK102_003046 [Quaeritorhiza haematococci]